MNSKSLGTIGSLVLLILTIGGFAWLWFIFKAPIAKEADLSNLKKVEISTVKRSAEELLNNKEKNSDIPIKTPTEKMGRENPFTAVK